MASFDYSRLQCPLCGKADLWFWGAGSVRCCACTSIMPRDWVCEPVRRPNRLRRVKMPLCQTEDV